jgi:hypothetical protein
MFKILVITLSIVFLLVLVMGYGIWKIETRIKNYSSKN